MLRQLPELKSCIVMWLNLDLLPCMVTGSWIDLDLHFTGSWVPGYNNTQLVLNVYHNLKEELHMNSSIGSSGWVGGQET